MKLIASFVLTLCLITGLSGQPLIVAGRSSQLNIRDAENHSLRITLKPASFAADFLPNPAIAERPAVKPFITLDRQQPLKTAHGNFVIEIAQQPLRLHILSKSRKSIQCLQFNDDGTLQFALNGEEQVLGMGEGGSKPGKGVDWRALPVEFDRRGIYDSMQPRWQSDAYGSRNPVPMLVGTSGWALFIASPWVHVDLTAKDRGKFLPFIADAKFNHPQTEKNQGANAGKGLPPADQMVPGLYDLFVFDATEPQQLMQDFSRVTGPAAMPPKWAFGYMQSHRRLDSENQMLGVVDTFRSKRIPLDAVIYLGTGFTPVGWNTKQPSFDFNPEIFKQDPGNFVSAVHAKNAKVVLHMVPWDRDRLPTLHGTIPARPSEQLDASHIRNYWKQHMPLLQKGVDGFWPDEGDWFNLFERIKRHQLYYQGHLSAHPDIRPWSLHRNGYPGIAQWGGWVWSGDTESSWKTLEAQIAVALNYSLSIGPYWGSDIGGFFPNEELTGELYTRWFQFGAFCASFRSHGVTWRTRLPWGWGGNDMYPKESKTNPLQSEMNNAAVEPIVKKYDELRYQLLPYTYSLSREASTKGLPLMRALWLHYPQDKTAAAAKDEFLWGRDMLVAPVFGKGAAERKLYLPAGDWYDWWTNEMQEGGQTIRKKVDLAVMPIYVRAGAVIPVDPVRQFTAEPVEEPTTLRIYSGADGESVLYEDDGISMQYEKGQFTLMHMRWSDKTRQLLLMPDKAGLLKTSPRKFVIQLLPQNLKKEITWNGVQQVIKF